MEAVGGQLWRIQYPDGTVTTISSNMRDIVPAGYELISPPSSNVFTGLRVLDTNSTWNGTTFKCIAFTPANVHEQNDSAKEVILEVGGEYRTCILFTSFSLCKRKRNVGTLLCNKIVEG